MPQLTAADVMNPEVLAVRPDLTIQELAEFLTENQITGAPVLDAQGRLVGVVSETDVIEGEMTEGLDLVDDRSDPASDVRGWEDKVSGDEMRELHVRGDSLLVRDIMTPAAYTVPHDTPVPRLAQTMIAGRIHRLLVTRDQRVVGIVTSLDLLKLLCAPGSGAPYVARRSVRASASLVMAQTRFNGKAGSQRS